jgi:hypothetical protein
MSISVHTTLDFSCQECTRGIKEEIDPHDVDSRIEFYRSQGWRILFFTNPVQVLCPYCTKR